MASLFVLFRFLFTFAQNQLLSDMRTYSQIKQELRERMERAFAVCDRQIQRIEEALSDLGMTLPMSVEEHADLSREQIRC